MEVVSTAHKKKKARTRRRRKGRLTVKRSRRKKKLSVTKKTGVLGMRSETHDAAFFLQCVCCSAPDEDEVFRITEVVAISGGDELEVVDIM